MSSRYVTIAKTNSAEVVIIPSIAAAAGFECLSGTAHKEWGHQRRHLQGGQHRSMTITSSEVDNGRLKS